ncbi:Uncharacterized protein Rs2_18435 [Raphanus sativus]|nr:Uncharacterized protein Rs2_18435 [Raphanus sativus]
MELEMLSSGPLGSSQIQCSIRCFFRRRPLHEANGPSGCLFRFGQTSRPLRYLFRDVNSVKSKNGVAVSSGPGKPIVKTGVSSGVRIGVWNQSSVPIGDKGKSIVSGDVRNVISFKDVTFGPHEGEVRFWLIHFWEA